MIAAPPDLAASVVSPGDLSVSDIAAWRRMQAQVLDFSNPLFSHDFAESVARARSDARVAVFRRADTPKGFLAFHKRPNGFARPIGAPFCDYHGIVSDRHLGVSGADALALCGIREMRASRLVDPFGHFAAANLAPVDVYVLRPEASGEAHYQQLLQTSPKWFKNYRRLEAKLEREVGTVRYVAEDTNRAAFTDLMAWKRTQYQTTGLQDVLRPDWVRALMDDLFNTRTPDFSGRLSSLYAGETLVAAYFGVRSGSVFHPWIASANPDLRRYSPGHLYLIHAVRAMEADGLTSIELSSGHSHYKRLFEPETNQAGEGMLYARQPRPSRLPAPPRVVRKVINRLDHIAAVDPTAMGMIRGLSEAAGATKLRLFGNEISIESAS